MFLFSERGYLLKDAQRCQFPDMPSGIYGHPFLGCNIRYLDMRNRELQLHLESRLQS